MNPKTSSTRVDRILPLSLLALFAALGASASALGRAPLSAGPRQDALSADAAVGRVRVRGGVAARRGVLADRWGPAEEHTRREVGEWVMAGARGANALKLALSGGAQLILGPGGLLEIQGSERVVLTAGELEASVPQGRRLDVGGPGGSSVQVSGRAVLRAHDRNLNRLEEEPRWLEGYKGNASSEALGSLLCEIDGRNVPLTMGYHQVTVDVRDQIARTQIEESFENHTDTVLEGVFYFPLPAGASISGFGMWIGDELVEGEIVEKERAREIYETILRVKRDPGLLEWAGGNVCKARVYPIGREKRIRIVYTQVLPKEGDTFAWHYALQSDLLRQHPLRRLRIQVAISSAEPLAAVTSPSHDCRIRATEHGAQVEFEAQAYAPDRDFELRVSTQAPPGALTLIPHRRGDDGYFMLLLNAPAAAAARRERKAEPLELIVMADTSGSMWGPPRENQVAFVEALLGALSERDAINLVTCDVETRWAFERPRANTPQAREAAFDFLEAREPLGWSDLETAFAQVCERAGPRTQVVYVGDGAPTAGDPDPAAFARTLERLYRGQGTFHAVVPGSSSEAAVVAAISGLGGGSLRTIGGGTDPSATAFELLEELTTPAVKDLALTFEGLSVAAVHPERLPNLPAGRQHIVLGRFDPLAGDLSGRVRVRGTLEGERVSLEEEVQLSAGDEGNSFIPRLWARSHLDHLLEQGASREVRERVIALSEDFQILTPNTSFLVLESDADRERFAVEKRFRMRDGEEFFSAGREAARHELVRAQMLAAKGWRRRMQAGVLAALSRMGREATELLRQPGLVIDDVERLGALGYVGGGERSQAKKDGLAFREDFDAGRAGKDEGEPPSSEEGFGDELLRQLESPAEEPASEADEFFLGERERKMARSEAVASPALAFDQRSSGRLSSSSFAWEFSKNVAAGLFGPYWGDPFLQLFPMVPAPRGPDPASTWSPELTALLRTLDRRTVIAAAKGGFVFEGETVYADARGRRRTLRSSHLLGPDRWLELGPRSSGNAWAVQWLSGARRGFLLEGWRLGRTRAAEEGDAGSWSAPCAWYFGDDLRNFVGYEASAEDLGQGRVRVSLRHPSSPKGVYILLIEREQALVLEAAWSDDGEVKSRTTFGAFQEAGGAWWPGEVRIADEQGRETTLTTLRVAPTSAAELESRIAPAFAERGDALLLGEDPEDLQAAKQAARDGKASLEDRWLLLRYYARTQRWNEAAPHLAAIEALAAGRPGLVPIRAAYLQNSRENEALAGFLLQAAADLAETPREAELDLSAQLLAFASALNQGNERLFFLRAVEPVFDRHPEVPEAKLAWDHWLVGALQSMNRPAEVFAQWRAMAEAYPYVANVQAGYTRELAQRGEIDAALEGLAQVESENGPWQPWEVGQLRQATLDILWNGYRLEQLVPTVEGWLSESPERVDSQAADRLLSALVFLDREREAWAKVEAWLALARADELAPNATQLIQAAVQHALGQGYGLYSWRLRYDDARAAFLADSARILAHRDELVWIAGQILQHHLFRQTDALQPVLAELFAEVQAGVEELPAQRLQLFFQWLRGGGFAPQGDEEAWTSILERVYARWLTATTDPDRSVLQSIVLSWGPRELQLRLHRHALEVAKDEPQRVAAAQALFVVLMAGPWTQAVEDELFGLLPALALANSQSNPVDETAAGINLDQRIVALYDLTSWLPEARVVQGLAALPGVNEMPRRILAAERERLLKAARAALITRLATLGPELEPERLRAFAAVERVWLQVKTAVDVEAARARSLELLTALIETWPKAAEEQAVPARDHVLAVRCATTLSWLLARTPEAQRVAPEAAWSALLERGLASGSELLDWREAKQALLLALDRGDELEAELSGWYGGGEELAAMRWGRALGYVLAERGQLERAAEVFEQVARLDELGSEDLHALAGWYTALDRADAARGARLRSYEALGEHALGNRLNSDSGAYQRSGEEPPPELDPEIPLRFIALLRKAANPANWQWTLHRYYAATKDFRLLECLPEAVLGHSAQGIYPFLEQSGALFDLVQEEATVDRLRAHLADLREQARTDVDRRALRLLEFGMLRRAAAQAHGTERHAEGALAALRAAAKGEWTEGEPALMASFLASQGTLQPESLAEEQLRLLRELTGASDNAFDRFTVSGHLARTLWGYRRADEALRTLEGALQVLRSASGGRLPESANSELQMFAGWLESLGSWRKAEAVWLAELEAGHLEMQRLWLIQRQHELYRNAVLARAELALGKGPELYRAVVDSFRRELARRTNEQHTGQLIATLCDLWIRAHRDLREPAAAGDASSFAFGELPVVLSLYQYRGGQQMVSAVAECLDKVRDARTALEFLTVRAETEPGWLALMGQEFWSQHSGRYGDLRHRAGALESTLEARVLAVVLRELYLDLRSRQTHSRTLYDMRYSYFWVEKREDFRRAALAVLEERRDSGRTVAYAAEYLYRGLSAHEDAIAALLDAHARGILDIPARRELCVYLQERARWKESLPLLVELVADHPAAADVRVMLMRAYFHVGDVAGHRRTLAEAQAWFRENDLWNEAVIAELAAGCLDTRLFPECVDLYREAIALHEKNAPGRGVGDGVLSSYWRSCATALSGLGRTDEAVDAAAGAIVAWGGRIDERAQDLQRLRDILVSAADLEGYLVRLDQEVARTGLENPILRKALGQALRDRGSFQKAAEQLRLALDAQPNDAETHDLLVQACDKMKRPELAAEAMLERARLAAHEVGLWARLGDRLSQLEQIAAAERAYTSLVEALPNESEGHQELAEIRQKQRRWDEAAERWRQVMRVRSQEPTGYLGLARCLMQLERWDEAREVVDQLLSTSWPERFGDVRAETERLLQRIQRAG